MLQSSGASLREIGEERRITEHEGPTHEWTCMVLEAPEYPLLGVRVALLR